MTNLKGKKSKKEPRVKQDKVEKEKEKEVVANKKESVQELEKQLEQETKEINTEVITELKKNLLNNASEFTQDHQDNFGIDPTPSKPKEKEKEIITEKPQTKSPPKKKEHHTPKNYHPPETPSFSPYSMFPMFNPMMMPNADGKGQTPMCYMIPVPVDPSQFPKDYWQNMSMYYPMMQNIYPPNFNKQNSNSKK